MSKASSVVATGVSRNSLGKEYFCCRHFCRV